jgi:hypothetical protein
VYHYLGVQALLLPTTLVCQQNAVLSYEIVVCEPRRHLGSQTKEIVNRKLNAAYPVHKGLIIL